MKFKFLSESNELPFQGSFSVWISTDSTGQSLLPRVLTNSWYDLPSFLYSFVHLYKSFHIYMYKYIYTYNYLHMYIHTHCMYKMYIFWICFKYFFPILLLAFWLHFSYLLEIFKILWGQICQFFSLGTLGFVVQLLNFLDFYQLAYLWLLSISLVTIHRELSQLL